MGSIAGNIEGLCFELDKHFASAQPKMTVKREDFLGAVEENMLHMPVIGVEKFLEPLLESKSVHIREVGSQHILRHGVSLSIEDDKSGGHMLARLYVPTGLPRHLVNPLIDKLHELKPHRVLNLHALIDTHLHDIHLASLRSPTTDASTHYYAEAEITARTIAAAWTHDTNPFPTALVDSTGRAVGFTLVFPEAVTHARDFEAEVTDTLFDDPMGITYGPSKTLPHKIRDEYELLKLVNVKPYMEAGFPSDLTSMILLDHNDEFVTFNRVGYVLEQEIE